MTNPDIFEGDDSKLTRPYPHSLLHQLASV